MTASERTRWERRLRTACETLHCTSHATLNALLVTGRVAGDAADRDQFLALSRRLAEEYGLAWAGRVEGDKLSVRFSREPA
jgi:hypothetical protein